MDVRLRATIPSPEGFQVYGEMVGPTLIELSTFAGTLPLGPGDVLQVSHGPTGAVATGVQSIRPQWIVEIHARTPQTSDTDESAWEAAQLAADEMVEQLAEFPRMLRTTRFSALVTSRSWGRISKFIQGNSHVGHYEVFRSGKVEQLDWATLVSDPWQMDRPMYDRFGQRVD